MKLESSEGKRALLMCSGYFYWGRVVSVDLESVTLTDAHIVYETGIFKPGSSEWKYAQLLPFQPHHVRRSAIESFAIVDAEEA